MAELEQRRKKELALTRKLARKRMTEAGKGMKMMIITEEKIVKMTERGSDTMMMMMMEGKLDMESEIEVVREIEVEKGAGKKVLEMRDLIAVIGIALAKQAVQVPNEVAGQEREVTAQARLANEIEVGIGMTEREVVQEV